MITDAGDIVSLAVLWILIGCPTAFVTLSYIFRKQDLSNKAGASGVITLTVLFPLVAISWALYIFTGVIMAIGRYGVLNIVLFPFKCVGWFISGTVEIISELRRLIRGHKADLPKAVARRAK